MRGNIKIRPWQSSPIFVLSLDIDTSLAPYLGLYIIKMRCCMLWRQKGRFINKSFYTMSKIRSSSSSSSRAQLCSGYESYDMIHKSCSCLLQMDIFSWSSLRFHQCHPHTPIIPTCTLKISQTSLPYFGVKLSCVCLMFAYRKPA